MNDNKIHESLLQKNIELIDSYSLEEKKELNLIFEEFKKCQNCYETSNSLSVSKKINNLKDNLTNIYTNRKSYSNILENVIKRYIKTAESVVLSAKKLEGEIDVNQVNN